MVLFNSFSSTYKLRAWKKDQEKKGIASETSTSVIAAEDDRKFLGIDLTQFMSLSSNIGEGESQRRGKSSLEREIVRRYIEKAYEMTKLGDEVNDDVTRFSDDDGVEFDIERALCNPSAQNFFLSVLSQRCE